jgi:deoxyadenosine/deoxycytidine kinase
MYNKAMFIGIVGCMGVGKSRLTDALAKHLGYKAYFEPVKENPYLDDFYADAKRWSFEMQIYMLTSRFRQHLEVQALTKKDIGIVQDQIIYGDVLYAQLTHQFGFMDDRDFTNYKNHFETLRPLLQLPDVVVNLETSIDTVYDRIHNRGRVSEKKISREYLTGLTKLFDDWTVSVEDKTKVIHLDWTTFQPVEQVVKEIERQLEVQLPLPVAVQVAV